MTTGVRILGVGVGLFIVLALWTIALLAWVLLHRSKGALAYSWLGAAAFALFVTVVLTVIPKAPEIPAAVEEVKIYDEYFIGRIIIVVFMGIAALGSVGLIVVNHCMLPIYATPLKKPK